MKSWTERKMGETGKWKIRSEQRRENKTKKLRGEEHKNRKGEIEPAKSPELIVCKDTCFFKCHKTFSENDRKQFVLISGTYGIIEVKIISL